MSRGYNLPDGVTWADMRAAWNEDGPNTEDIKICLAMAKELEEAIEAEDALNHFPLSTIRQLIEEIEEILNSV
jgi:hypothetical protein